MFGFFRKKTLELIACNIVSMLNLVLWKIRSDVPRGGKLPTNLSDDKFFLGYMWGLARAGMYVTGVTSEKHRNVIMLRVYELLFPGDESKVLERCLEWTNNKDEIYLNALNLGIDESSVMFKAMMSRNEETIKQAASALTSLERHVVHHYLGPDEQS